MFTFTQPRAAIVRLASSHRLIRSTATSNSSYGSSLTSPNTTTVAPFATTTTTASKKKKKLRIVVAVGGNALQRRGDPLTIDNMLKAALEMAPTMASLAKNHELVLTHGNGPQVGALALERTSTTLDVLGAESVGQIGHILARAMHSAGLTAIPILTQVVVDPSDAAFDNPTKFVGPIYDEGEATQLTKTKGWVLKPDGGNFRRVVPSPPPLEILQLSAVETLLRYNPEVLPIVCGGGGVPVSRDSSSTLLHGVEAVIDKDLCGAKLAVELNADAYVVFTDGGGIWENYGKVDAREMEVVSPGYLREVGAGREFPGSMGPKIEAAIGFVEGSRRKRETEGVGEGGGGGVWAAIGDLKDAAKIIEGLEGTVVREDVVDGVVWRGGKV